MKFNVGDIVYVGFNTAKSSLVNYYQGKKCVVIPAPRFRQHLANDEVVFLNIVNNGGDVAYTGGFAYPEELIPQAVFESPLYKALNEL